MGLADTLATPKRTAKGPLCLACRLLVTLQGDELTAYRAALANPAWESKALARALRAEGHDVSDYGMQRHRRGECLGTRL
jgi:hypothetical protein